VAGRRHQETLKPHLKGRWIRETTRQAIYERDGHRCSYCSRDLSGASPAEIVLDHVKPDGGNAPSNLATSCKECNDAKGGKKVVDFLRENSKNPQMAKDLMAALNKKLAAKKKPVAKKAKAKAKKPNAKKPMKDALGVSGPKVVSKVNKKGAAAAKRKKIAGKPATRRSLAAAPDRTSPDTDGDGYPGPMLKKRAMNLV